MHHPNLREISALIDEILGLHFPKNRWGDLERGLFSASKELGFGESIDTLAMLLADRNSDPRYLDVVANHLTVGETYFFREKHSLDVFQSQIIPELLAERFGKDQRINIWSAGCCTGEEPYTLAMLLMETIPDISKWNISILATDLNPQFLKKAKEGIYSTWSFRETPKEVQSRYFKKIGAGWQIDETIRKMVHFRQVNLSETDFYAQQNMHKSLDVIFCRNVLMYFSPELIRRVGRGFYDVLAPQGWFITSPVELSDELFDEFGKVQYDKCIVYRKTIHKQVLHKPVSHPHKRAEKPEPLDFSFKSRKAVADKPPKAKHTNPIVGVQPYELAEHLFRRGQYAECATLCRSELLKAREKHSWQRLLSRSFANMGQLEESLKVCQEMLNFNRLDADTYYLMATILVEKSELGEAVKVLNQGFYIDPDHLMSHLLMAGILRRMSKDATAAIHLEKIKKLLNGLDVKVVLDETEGLTVGSILEMVESQWVSER